MGSANTQADISTSFKIIPDIEGKYKPFPLTDIQHAYWIGRDSSLVLGNVACHVYFEWRLQRLDLRRLEAAWNTVLRRHDMMRAVVLPDGSQRILEQVPYYRIAIDELPQEADAAEAALAATRERMSVQVMDASRWPLFELRASRLPDGALHLHLDIDLLMFDVQSFHIFLAELERIYIDPDARLGSIEVSFRDYVLEKQAQRVSTAYREARQWWLGRLDRVAPAPDLPLAAAPEALQKPGFTRSMRTMPKAQWQALSAKGAARGLTGTSVLLAAFSEVLANWARQPRFTLNLTHFNRDRLHPDIAKVVGDFTSVLLVAADCDGPVAFAERARAIQKEMWSGLAHRAFSSIEVMRELARGEGGVSGAMMPVVFTSLLGMEIDHLADASRAGALLGEPLHLRTATPQVWLDHQVMIRHGNLVYNWIVIDALFPEGMIADMLDEYGGLLSRLAASEEAWNRPVGRLLPPGQRAARQQANDTAVARNLVPLADAFLARCGADADRSAVIYPDGTLTYAELEHAARRIGGKLRAAGLKHGERVAVIQPKSPLQIASVLGVLIAGGAYVPIAVDAPTQRLARICKDTGIALALCSDGIALPDDVARLDPESASTGPERWDGPPDTSVNDLAYVIYTSGSTGTPKGVMTAHGAAANTIADINERYGVGRDDRVLGVSSLTFDLSVYDIFGPLSAGGALVLPREEDRLDPAHWLTLLRDDKVTLWNSVPALITMLADYAEAGGETFPAGLRQVLVSGDWVPLDLPKKLRRLAADVAIAALGGATEASIWSNYFDIASIDPAWKSIPYGFPLSNQRYHVLDRHYRNRPDWAAGDLYIAGDGLALGYWGDPERTAQAFVTHPETGERLYRTGDIARYRPGGMLEFLGRDDDQVKIGGHRIELGEIDAALARLDGVREGRAALVGKGDGSRQIVGFLVPEDKPGDRVFQQIDPLPEEFWVAAASPSLIACRRGFDPALSDAVRSFAEAGDRFAVAVINQVLAGLGWFRETGAVQDLQTRMADSGIRPRYRKLIGQWCELLCCEAVLARHGEMRYAAIRPVLQDEGAYAHALDELSETCRMSGAGAALYDWIAESAAHQLEMLRGDREPLEILFPGGDYSRANDLYRLNPVSVHFSAIVADIVSACAEARTADKPLRIMEVGAGTGGTTAHILPHLDPARTRYRFTDLSPFFLDRARQEFATHLFLEFSAYDINITPRQQGEALHEQDVVLAVNVLHDARNVVASLKHLRCLLRPGGVLIILEATRNTTLQLITAGFLEGFSDFEDQREDVGLPLMDAQDWCDTAKQAGFCDAVFTPRHDVGLGQHIILCRAPDRAVRLDQDAVERALAADLPAYMRPRRYVEIERLPLSANGKIDRKALSTLVPYSAGKAGDREPPRGRMEETVARLWQSVFGLEAVGRNDNFFLLGGDSLMATRVIGELGRLAVPAPRMQLLYENPVLRDFAEALAPSAAPAGNGNAADMFWPSSLTFSRPARRGSIQHRLILLPGSDGSGYAFRQLADSLGDNWAVEALQTPGIAEGDAPIDNLPDLGRYFAEIIAERTGDEDEFHLGGWSFGALAANEAAHTLLEMGRAPSAMVLIDPPPLGAFRKVEADPLAAFGVQPGDVVETEAGAGRAALWRAVLARYGLLPDGAETENPRTERLIARFEAMLAAHLTALRACEDNAPAPLALVKTVLRIGARDRPPQWSGLACRWADRGTSIQLPCRHWDVIRDPVAVRRIAAEIRNLIV